MDPWLLWSVWDLEEVYSHQPLPPSGMGVGVLLSSPSFPR